jgi:hypothetical protein
MLLIDVCKTFKGRSAIGCVFLYFEERVEGALKLEMLDNVEYQEGCSFPFD